MTFQEYINNPTGIGSMVMFYRKLYEDLYSRFSNILARENGNIKYTLWKDGSKACYCYIKIPSEIINNFYYDVIIKMKVDKNSMSLENCETQFFTNDPNFMYVYAHAFNKAKLTIPELEFKMSKTSLTQKPVQKNPQEAINYVKSLYFAHIVMRKYGLFQRARYISAPEFDKKKFDKLVEDTEKKVKARQDAEDELNKEKRRLKAEENRKSQRREPTSIGTNSPNIRTNNTSKNIKTIGTVGNKFPVNKTVKKTNNIKTRR